MVNAAISVMPQLRLDGSSYSDLEFSLVQYLRKVSWAPVGVLSRKLGTDRYGIWIAYCNLVSRGIPISHGSERLKLSR